ncbi:DUF418 domain-containing protein [Corallococcus sp. CA053C]|uniref:DUF418 domain-containing protein n=1 Tax=Corallococcus sp. CA053C TaxID=2316732 RepID=UPI000EA06D1D|nr:DUF418 domain-containing protein [Corallococcus sp. CA053C]RKH04427.1 DUF418 domain-containing protein [Corallococcus sp. CA053C]
MPEPSADSVGPVDLSERVHVLDALRGFALAGVFISNSLSWFSGRILLPREQSLALAAPLLDTVVSSLYSLFIDQKFITLFSFLFGLGFSLQMTRAESRGVSIVPLYRRRLVVLLGIGAVHMFALWVGDILSTYALLGFVLLLFRKRTDRTLLTWALVLYLVMPPVIMAVQTFGPVLVYGEEETARAAKVVRDEEAANRTAFLAGLASDSVVTSQQANLRFGVQGFSNPNRLLWLCIILGRFLLGMWAGRQRLMQDVERHRKLLRRLVAWGLTAGGALGGAALAVNLSHRGMAGWPPANPPLWMVVMRLLREPGFLVMGAAYAAAFALLFQKERWRKALSVFAPAGRMALTLYLMQTVVSLWLYDGWGLGLVGHLPASTCALLTVVVFAVQVGLSHLWLARFRFGPVEWLWRSLTYGRAQPMRLASPSPAGATH